MAAYDRLISYLSSIYGCIKGGMTDHLRRSVLSSLVVDSKGYFGKNHVDHMVMNKNAFPSICLENYWLGRRTLRSQVTSDWNENNHGLE